MFLGIIYLAISCIFLSGYVASLKPFDNKIIILFWAEIFSYIGYVSYALFQEKALLFPEHAWKDIMFDYTLINFPFYFAIGIFTFLSFYLYSHLIDNYDVSIVFPVLKMSMLIQTTGYILLGEKPKIIALIGVFIVFCGSLISAWPSPSPQSIDEFKKKFPFILILLTIVTAFLKALNKITTFLLTQVTPATENVQNFLNHTFGKTSSLTLTYVNPFHYNVGVRFFITVTFLIYIVFIKKEGANIIKVFREHFYGVLMISGLFLGYISFYYAAYQYIPEKIIISPLTKLSLPVILGFSYYFLNEKITKQKIAGYIIIIAGAFISIM